MTDQEIIKLAGSIFYKGNNTEAVAFARAIESRTLTNQKAKWYQEGLVAEREACAKICDDITGEKGRQYILASYIAQEIRARR